MAATKKGLTTVAIYPDWCKGCGLCAAFCPKKVFEMDPVAGKARVVNEEECVNCGFCELHCPDFAIVLSPKNTDTDSSNNPTAKAKP
ncbi:MAG: 4Fe-4S dicluster domain-containing protein [Desulfovibrio sp.]|nr:MAG: 4Fe-4S dicluster domain-containing protein [Desulfovibrio sp.]